jgi:hypothetical protein
MRYNEHMSDERDHLIEMTVGADRASRCRTCGERIVPVTPGWAHLPATTQRLLAVTRG